MNIANNKSDVNTSLIKRKEKHEKSFCPKRLENHLILSKRPSKFFQYPVNWLNYRIITQYNWNESCRILGITFEQLSYFRDLFKQCGFDNYYNEHDKELASRHHNKNYKKKKRRPEYGSFESRFKYRKVENAMNEIKDLTENQKKALYAIIYKIWKGRPVYQKEIKQMIGLKSNPEINKIFQQLKTLGYINWSFKCDGKVNQYEVSNKAKLFFRKCFDLQLLINEKSQFIENEITRILEVENTNIINNDLLKEKESLEKIIFHIENEIGVHKRFKLFYFKPKYRRKFESTVKRIEELENLIDKRTIEVQSSYLVGNKFTKWLGNISKNYQQ